MVRRVVYRSTVRTFAAPIVSRAWDRRGRVRMIRAWRCSEFDSDRGQVAAFADPRRCAPRSVGLVDLAGLEGPHRAQLRGLGRFGHLGDRDQERGDLAVGHRVGSRPCSSSIMAAKHMFVV